MNIVERALAPTPGIFRILRNAGLVLAAASAALLSSPIVLPPIVAVIAGYGTVAGAVLTAISQITVQQDYEPQEVPDE